LGTTPSSGKFSLGNERGEDEKYVMSCSRKKATGSSNLVYEKSYIKILTGDPNKSWNINLPRIKNQSEPPPVSYCTMKISETVARDAKSGIHSCKLDYDASKQVSFHVSGTITDTSASGLFVDGRFLVNLDQINEKSPQKNYFQLDSPVNGKTIKISETFVMSSANLKNSNDVEFVFMNASCQKNGTSKSYAHNCDDVSVDLKVEVKYTTFK
jgi:hypothetical protein